ncbi:hypothetical protein [Actinomadura roseirufa]|uniref:hypothetical protein n=1 Tax=Actinomadura roseirufa TaxID=2094049 RepID=UPI0010414734|nr:hypothetical protein [Actinomadura roseirufa]
MTEDNRGPVKAPSGDDEGVHDGGPERQEAAAPPDTVADQELPLGQPAEPAREPGREPGADDGDRLVAGGFAPPDGRPGAPSDAWDDVRAGMPQEVPLQDAPPRDMPQPPPPVPLDKPLLETPEGRPPRPGFVPHHQDPRAQGAAPYGGGCPGAGSW